MKAIEVTFPGGRQVTARFDGWVVETDQSVAHGGNGSAPEPFDLFLSSLATCAGAYVLGFCQARGISTLGMSIVQEHVFADGVLSDVRLKLHLPAGFPEKYLRAVRAAAEGCRVKKLLHKPPNVVVEAERGLEPELERTSLTA